MASETFVVMGEHTVMVGVRIMLPPRQFANAEFIVAATEPITGKHTVKTIAAKLRKELIPMCEVGVTDTVKAARKAMKTLGG
jgi:hypothetical protein